MRFNVYGLCTQILGADGMIGAVGTKHGEVQVYELGTGILLGEERGKIYTT